MDCLRVCQQRVLQQRDIVTWVNSRGYNDYIKFIKQLNEFSKEFRNDLVTDKMLIKVVQLLNHLSDIVDQVQPIYNDEGQRFGNKAYQIWFDRMKDYALKVCLEIFGTYGEELFVYLHDSFGNKTRIDYGTGHEMCFIIFLMGIHQLILIPEELSKLPPNEHPSRDVFKAISLQILSIFSNTYMPLVRKIQTRYRLEPAGSHGAFSLDDFQFLPFYFGSSQLINTDLSPNSFPDKQFSEQHSQQYMFLAAVSFIHQVKTGLFAEHSNQLWNISAVQDWHKINTGLFKMYINEYLPKFQIVQHLLFGENVLIWRPNETSSN